MKYIIVVLSLLGAGLLLHKPSRSTERQSAREHAQVSDQDHQETPSRSSQKPRRAPAESAARQIAARQNSPTHDQQKAMSPGATASTAAAGPSQSQAGSGRALAAAAAAKDARAETPTQKSHYDESDRGLLMRAAQSARESGSRIAYIGKVEELYAFDPKFFAFKTDRNGQKMISHRRVETYENVQTPQGPAKVHITREPYPVPPYQGIDYQRLSYAVMRATDDGAMVINLTSPGVDRLRLEPAINYARRRGSVVVNLPPPGQ